MRKVFCSTIVPTIGRSSLPKAIQSVLNQSFDAADFEVIVVNDSGRPLPESDWRGSPQVRLIDTNRRERSVARNAGAAMAKGKYLHFLDDDDILLPGALEAFWRLDGEGDGAAWLYGNYQTVGNSGNLIEEVAPGITGNVFALLVAGESIPLQASFLNAEEFFTAGAFDPCITGVEDRDLGRRIALRGKVAYTSARVAQIRIGQEGSSTQWSILAEDDRRAREKALSAERAFERLRQSAASCYWRGRVSRAYLGSTVWNGRHGNILTAASRAAAGLVFGGWEVFSRDFFRGLRTEIDTWPRPESSGRQEVVLGFDGRS
ncbi:MAG: glycosyltransferase family 2 protein [Acidobacteriota bacterium]